MIRVNLAVFGGAAPATGASRECPRHCLRIFVTVWHREPHSILPIVVRITRGADQLANEEDTQAADGARINRCGDIRALPPRSLRGRRTRARYLRRTQSRRRRRSTIRCILPSRRRRPWPCTTVLVNSSSTISVSRSRSPCPTPYRARRSLRRTPPFRLASSCGRQSCVVRSRSREDAAACRAA